MATASKTGNDTLTFYTPDHRVFADFADGTVMDIKFPNEIATVKTGKNGNAIYGLNETGRQAVFEIRLIRGSSDDKYLLGLLNQQNANFSGTIFISGQFIKKIGFGTGTVSSDIYNLSGGVVGKEVPGMSNVEGSTDQSVAIYMIQFSTAVRVIS